MCGIFAYLHYRKEVSKIKCLKDVLSGLKRLEYRGYDSSGICSFHSKKLNIIRSVGKIDNLVKEVELRNTHMNKKYDQGLCMSHTRWATHGEPSIKNAHPHSNKQLTFAVVHNGIIFNYSTLRIMLQKEGYSFSTDTDTEIIPILMQFLYESKIRNDPPTFPDLLRETLTYINGTYALLVMSNKYPYEIVAARKGSPLLLGIKSKTSVGMDLVSTSPKQSTAIKQLSSIIQQIETSNSSIELYLASDPSAVIGYTRTVIFFDDNDILHINNKGIFQFSTDSVISTKQIEVITTKLEEIMKGKFDTFMEKEIHEQQYSIIRAFQGRINNKFHGVKLGGIEQILPRILSSRRLIFIACGTSFNSCLATRHIIEKLSGIPTYIELASDFDDREPHILFSDTCIFVSQSGETADSLVCLDYCIKKGALCLGIVNKVGSTISRKTHAGIYINAGYEIGVASTKAYTSQFVALILLGCKLALDFVSKQSLVKQITAGLIKLPHLIKDILKCEPQISKLADKLKIFTSILVLGRGDQLATAREAALKIKELSYIHAECIGAGELKHGPLALLDKTKPVIVIATQDRLATKIDIAINQIKARAGKLIIICNPNSPYITLTKSSIEVITVPKSESEYIQGILNIIPLQLLSMHLAIKLKRNVDQPRHLAKSVTVG